MPIRSLLAPLAAQRFAAPVCALSPVQTELTKSTSPIQGVVPGHERALGLRERQAAERVAVGLTWSDRELVFSTRTGVPLDAANVRREFRAACKAAKIGQGWTPRDCGIPSCR